MSPPLSPAQALPLDPSKLIRRIRIAVAALLLLLFAGFVALSFRWPWMNDSGVMHYIVFLLQHGLAPYRQIVDINLPGSYLSEFVGLTLFGSSDLAWRLYDYTLLATLTLACLCIASKYDWFAGLFAGVLFSLIHGSEGPWQTAQRDEVMAILALVGYSFVFAAVRRRQAPWFFCAGLAFGCAGIIKPTIFAVEVLLVALALRAMRQQGLRLMAALMQVSGGTCLILLGTLAFLLTHHSLHAFFNRVLHITAFYSTLVRPPSAYMLHYSAPRGLLPLLPIAALLFFWNRSWRNWELLAIAGGVCFSFASYWVQHKGFTYHRYPFIAFALLWVGLECGIALRTPGQQRWFGAAGLLIGSLLVAPFYLLRLRGAEQPNLFVTSLVTDLGRYPRLGLQGHVQCLDGVDGCYSALYRLRLMQCTGTMGDQLLFSTVPSPAAESLRAEFWSDLQAAPPELFILTNYWYGEPQSFRKLDAWPLFADYLRSHYELVQQRNFNVPGQSGEPVAYQIYRRR